jgi:hypothetical protein
VLPFTSILKHTLSESGLELRAAGGAGIGKHVADVGHAGGVHDHPLEAQAEAGVGARCRSGGTTKYPMFPEVLAAASRRCRYDPGRRRSQAPFCPAEDTGRECDNQSSASGWEEDQASERKSRRLCPGIHQ